MPSGVWRDPIRTRSGIKRSLIAVPSMRNSGLERMSNLQLGLRVSLEDGMHRFSGTTWHGRFFNDNFGGPSNSSDAAHGEFDVAVEMKW